MRRLIKVRRRGRVEGITMRRQAGTRRDMLHPVCEMVLVESMDWENQQGCESLSDLDFTNDGKQSGGECLADEFDKSRIDGQERATQTEEGSPSPAQMNGGSFSMAPPDFGLAQNTRIRVTHSAISWCWGLIPQMVGVKTVPTYQSYQSIMAGPLRETRGFLGREQHERPCAACIGKGRSSPPSETEALMGLVGEVGRAKGLRSMCLEDSGRMAWGRHGASLVRLWHF